MGKKLVIAEKPSVAADIARALGGFVRHGDYFESDRYVLSSAVGHLLEIGMPEEEEVKRGKWTFAHLPAIPSKFALKPIEKNEARLKTLLKLIMNRHSLLVMAYLERYEGNIMTWVRPSNGKLHPEHNRDNGVLCKVARKLHENDALLSLAVRAFRNAAEP